MVSVCHHMYGVDSSSSEGEEKFWHNNTWYLSMNVSNFVPRNKEVLSGTLLRADYLERRWLCNTEGLHNDKWQWEHVSGSDTVSVEPVLVSICMTYCRPDLWHAHCQCIHYTRAGQQRSVSPWHNPVWLRTEPGLCMCRYPPLPLLISKQIQTSVMVMLLLLN